MNNYRINYPVFTFDNKRLLDSDTTLSAEVMETLLTQGKNQFKADSLLQYQDVKQDILSFLKQPPYDIIFANSQQLSELFEIMEGVRLPVPVLKTLHYFKSFDSYTYRHILIVFALSTFLSKILATNREDAMEEAIAFPTHDIGKICVPIEILNKKTPLTTSERHVLEHHTMAGYVLLSYYFQDTQSYSARVARDHHERKDGTGYPRGIKINDSLVDIIIVSDIYDALISPRAYRPVAYDNRTAIEEIIQMVEENKVNMETVQALVALNRAEKPDHSTCIISHEKRGTPPPKNVYGIIDDEKPGK